MGRYCMMCVQRVKNCGTDSSCILSFNLQTAVSPSVDDITQLILLIDLQSSPEKTEK